MKKPLALCLALVVLFAVSILVGNEPPLAKPEINVPLGDPIPAVESPVTLPEPGQHEKPEGIPTIPVGPEPVIPETPEKPETPEATPNVAIINGVTVTLDPRDPEALLAKNVELPDEVKALMDQTGKDHETIVRNLWKLATMIYDENDRNFCNPAALSIGSMFHPEYARYAPLFGYGSYLDDLFTDEGLEQLYSVNFGPDIYEPLFFKCNGIVYRKGEFKSGYGIKDNPTMVEIAGTGTAYTYEVTYIPFDFGEGPADTVKFIVEAKDGRWKIAYYGAWPVKL